MKCIILYDCFRHMMTDFKDEDVKIRPAVKEDCYVIRSLIQELADYEKMPEGPKITAEDLIRDGFGDNKFFYSHVAEVGSKIVGFCLFFYTYSTWEGKVVHMEDLYVQPEYRSRGVGTKLWKSIITAALEINCSRCNFQVLDWNKPSIKYYKRQGAVDLSAAEGWLMFRMNRKEMETFVSKT
ncbi:diamine acetyltransferase 2-like [Eurytemora carolleeae]|uniref:diamine acetyltransferase 2-like n=1 Tax=Eurytemora carolleeae TaxID=1294199 RepID=UPI000C7814D8|nr:diamine acetyltransferase 2-like [Eurytemora carolleeae]|eukprot:XP_023323958.1 diamine acetyltransferase 2-like [Eurytemora affinis]